MSVEFGIEEHWSRGCASKAQGLNIKVTAYNGPVF